MSVDEARSATSQNEPAKKLRFLRRRLHHERGGETQQERRCVSGAEQCWHPSRLITLSFFTFLRLLVWTQETSSSCPIPLQDFGSEVVFWYVAHVCDHSPFSNSASQLLTYSEHARRCFVSPTLGTTSPACPRFSTSGFSGRCPTAAVTMNSPSASRMSSSHWRILS